MYKLYKNVSVLFDNPLLVTSCRSTKTSSDNTVGGWKQVFEPRFTKLIKASIHRIVQIMICLFCIQFFEPQI